MEGSGICSCHVLASGVTTTISRLPPAHDTLQRQEGVGWRRQPGVVNPVSSIQCRQSGVVDLKFLSIHLPTTNQHLFQSLWSKYDPAGWKGQGFAPVVCWLVASLLQFRVCRQHTTLYRGRRVSAGVGTASMFCLLLVL